MPETTPAEVGLTLDRPLVVVDLETTGIDIQIDRIVEIAMVKVHPDGRRENYEKRVNPNVPIPKASSDIHGITNEDVKDAPKLKELAEEIVDFLKGCDLSGFNAARFDFPLLSKEIGRCGKSFRPENHRIVDAQTIFHLKEPRDLSAAVRYYLGHELEGAHGALADAVATTDVLLAQLTKYEDLPRDVPALAKMCERQKRPGGVDPLGKLRWIFGEVCIGFGKYRGMPLKKLARDDPGFLRWILGADFSDDVKQVVQGALSGRFPEPPPEVEAAKSKA